MAKQIGKINKRVELRALVVVQEADGNKVKSWPDITDNWWAGFRVQKGTESSTNRQEQAKKLINITIRYHKTIAEGWQIHWTDSQSKVHVFDILSIVDEDFSRNCQVLECVEVS